MLVKFFKNKGGGSPKASIDYLLGKDRQREGAEVLSGNPELSLAIAAGLDFKNKYTVGCLSFEEKDIPESVKYELIQKFENTIFAGLDREQYNICWIQHTDKNRLELNFFIPNVELTTEKRLQPYYDKADRWLVDAFKKVANHEYGFSDPDAPEKRQTLSKRFCDGKDRGELKEAITEHIESLVANGIIKDREGVLTAIADLGLEVSRTTKKSISIKNPDEGLNIRLTGVLYEQDFRIDTENQERIRERATDYQNRNEERYHEVYSRLERGINQRARDNIKKYSRSKHSLSTSRGIDNSNHLPVPGNLVAEKQADRSSRSTSEIRSNTTISEDKAHHFEPESRQESDYSGANQKSTVLEKRTVPRHQDRLKKLRDKANELLERVRKNIDRVTNQFRHSNSREHSIEERKCAIDDCMQQAIANEQRVRDSKLRINQTKQIIDADKQQTVDRDYAGPSM